MPQDRDQTRWAWITVAALTLLALVARLHGIGFLLPHSPEPDAVIVWQASFLDRPEGELANPASYPATYYPNLLSRLVYVLPGRSHTVPAPIGASDDELLDRAAGPYTKARRVMACISVAIIPLMFLLARRFFDPWSAVLAAALVGTSLLHLTHSQQARPHAPSAAVSLLAMLAVLALLERASWRNYIIAGIAAALAIGTLHNGVFVLPGLVLAHLLARDRRWLGLLSALVLVLIGLRVCYPWFFWVGILGPPGAEGLDIGGQTLTGRMFNGAGYFEIARGLFGFDPVLSVLAALGVGTLLFAAWYKRRAGFDTQRLREVAVLASYPAAFILLWGVMERVEPRFMISLLPYCALSAVVFLSAIASRLRFGASTAAVLALVVLAAPAVACARLVWLRGQEDTASQAARWIEQHADRDQDIVGLDFLLTLPVRQQRADLEALPQHARSAWERYQLTLDPAIAESGWRTRALFRPGMLMDKVLDAEEVSTILSDEGVSYAVVYVSASNYLSHIKTRAAVASRGELAASFQPTTVDSAALYAPGYEREWRAFENLWIVRQPGPPLEIYRLK